MKTLTIIVAIFFVGSSGYLIKVPTGPSSDSAPPRWMHLQKLVLPLFENVCEDSDDPVIIRSAQEFTSDLTTENYWKPDVLPNFQKLKNGQGFLLKGEIFTEYNANHLNELEVVYEVLYYAKNFDIFFKAAAWARQNLNCGLYLDAIYLAITSRKDTERLVVPAPYELLPNYFIRQDVILEGTKIAAGVNLEPSEGVHVEGNAYQLDANYTAIFYDNDDESKLAYFREDIGLNSYYFIRKLKQSPWFNVDINGRYGENVYQMMKQFMARYNLERYANGLPELESWTWNDPTLFDVPYDPMLLYTNGKEFISRTSPIELPDNEDLAMLQTIENNIGTVVSHMRDTGYNKTQILNHLMEILVTSDRSYETLARQLLGKAHSDNGCPSALDHYMTSLRDPLFWKINKKIVDLIDDALKILPPYSRNELYFPGVEVVNVEVKKMMTYYDYFEFDVTHALKTADNVTYQIKIGQPRLNHRPFSIKINITSLVTQRGVVKLYLGPKLLPGELTKKKNLFTLLDTFEYRFKIGSNIITRTSDDMKQFSEDFMSLKNLQKNIEDAEFGLNSLPLKTVESQIGYPGRMILPKGSLKGLSLQLFVFVAPYAKYSAGVMYSLKSMEFNKVIMNPGYPLDLVVQDKQLFELPNAMVKDIIVTHKGEGKVENYGGPGVTKKWYGSNTYDPSSRPNYSGNKKEPFDYSAKKGQYGKKIDDPFLSEEYELREHDGYKNNESFEDNYYIDDGEDSLFKLDSSSTDYTTKGKQPFDYKLKRADYGNYNDFVKSNNVPIESKASYSKIEVPVEQFDVKPVKVILEKDVVSAEIDNNIKNQNSNSVKVSALKLGSSSFDYTLNRKEPFDYKAKRAQYEKKSNFTQNKVDYRKDFVQIEDTSSNTADIAAEVSMEQLDINPVKVMLEKDVVSDEAINNIGRQHINSKEVSSFKLGSSSFDYTTKRKEPFDYKAKKAQYGKKGNFTRDKTVHQKDFVQKEDTSEAQMPVENIDTDVNKVVLLPDVSVEIVNTNNQRLEESLEVPDDKKSYEDYKTKPVLTPVAPKRRYSVYDYIIHAFDNDDSSEEKVYE